MTTLSADDAATAATGKAPQVFRLGLTLAGAVSAGAYSAGVLDFLREALEAWELAKTQGEGKDSKGCPVPTHRVQIQAISGTSAGAMCAAMFIGGLDKPLSPIKGVEPAPPGQARANPLYHAWVSRIDVLPMLSGDDLAKGSVKSILNCRILDEIAAEVLTPWQPEYRLQPWIAENAEVFLCTTSLRGIPYAVSSNAAGHDAYGMNLHAGVLKYRMVSTAAGASPDGEALAADAPALSWTSLRNAALASGAFPLALMARETTTPRATIEQRRWEVPTEAGREYAHNIASNLPSSLSQLRAVCVDGGVINNEPFEHVRLALSIASAGGTATKNDDPPRLARDIARSQAATILIDPFPDSVAFDPNYPPTEEASELTAVVKALLPAIVNQLRFKADELALAVRSDVGSRYLIAPSRPGLRHGEPTLACGALGGFVGFLDARFRHHDYILGRLNCQRFLQRHFYVAHTNPVVSAWATAGNASYVGSGYFGDAIGAVQAEHPEHAGLIPVPVIPLMPELRGLDAVLGAAHPALTWPSCYTEEALTALRKHLRKRLDTVLTRLIDKELDEGLVKTTGRLLMTGIAAVFRINPAHIAAEKITDHIRKVLNNAGLLHRE